jgi:4'-phosphopantetheinyl transferase
MTNSASLRERLENEAHVWFSDPDTITECGRLDYYLTLLSSDEAERHRRFHFATDRTRFLVSHALVRTVLSRYSATDPADWRFVANEHGRPEIDSPKEQPPLRFNLTHTAGVCACIVTLGLDCGIDTEHLSRSQDLRKIAERMFAAAELESLQDTDDMGFRRRFFHHWTLREAYCKALGVGIAGSTKNFHFEIGGNGQARIHFSNTTGCNADDWQLALLHPDPDHIAALAIHRPNLADRKIATWTITP